MGGYLFFMATVFTPNFQIELCSDISLKSSIVCTYRRLITVFYIFARKNENSDML